MNRLRTTNCLLIAALLALAACDDPYDPTPRPDYAIRVLPTAHGAVAVPPRCEGWATEPDPYDNQPMPNFGCASAGDLAAMVEKPGDLIRGRDMGDARGVTVVGAIRRYDNNQTRGLIVPGAEVNQAATTSSSNGASGLSGDITGSAGSGAASPAAATAGP